MLYNLAEILKHYSGPFRLLQSHLLLMAGGTFAAALLVGLLLPLLWNRLPRDRGKAICGPDGLKSAGKPTGAGLVVTLLTLPVIILFVPLAPWDALAVAGMYAAMLFGYLDDRASVPWGQLKKGLLDAVVAFFIAFCLAMGHTTAIWVPFAKGVVWTVPLALYLPCAAFLLWFSMNATNCTDGVDGLAGSLTLVSLVMLAVLLYLVFGYSPVARYLLVPSHPECARWAILSMTIAGGFGGYLWFNAEPSKVLMGDAGSRFLGIVIGAEVLVTGNPFLLIAIIPVVLVNGGGGLAKLVLLRVAKRLGRSIDDNSVIRRIRFPLHDHCKKNLGWSNGQVLLRFMLLQIVVMPVLLLILIKIR